MLSRAAQETLAIWLRRRKSNALLNHHPRSHRQPKMISSAAPHILGKFITVSREVIQYLAILSASRHLTFRIPSKPAVPFANRRFDGREFSEMVVQRSRMGGHGTCKSYARSQSLSCGREARTRNRAALFICGCSPHRRPRTIGQQHAMSPQHGHNAGTR